MDDELRDLAARPEILGAMVRLAKDDPCRKVAEHARHVRAPTLFIQGADDALVDLPYARRLFEIIRRNAATARFIEVPGGHMVHLTHPHRVSPFLEEWLTRTSDQ